MSVFHPTHYSSTIEFQGPSLLEDQITVINMAARGQESTIQTDLASYQVLEIVHNLFSNLSTT